MSQPRKGDMERREYLRHRGEAVVIHQVQSIDDSAALYKANLKYGDFVEITSAVGEGNVPVWIFNTLTYEGLRYAFTPAFENKALYVPQSLSRYIEDPVSFYAASLRALTLRPGPLSLLVAMTYIEMDLDAHSSILWNVAGGRPVTRGVGVRYYPRLSTYYHHSLSDSAVRKLDANIPDAAIVSPAADTAK